MLEWKGDKEEMRNDIFTEYDCCRIRGIKLTDPVEFFEQATLRKAPIRILSHSALHPEELHIFKLRTPDTGDTCIIEILKTTNDIGGDE